MVSDNLAVQKLFSTGPALVVAMDHGFFDGPIEGLEKPLSLPEKICPETDAVLLSLGMHRKLKNELFAHRGSPLSIIRINWSSIYCFTWEYHSGDTVAAVSPKEAVKAGVPIVLISLSLCTGSEKRDTENVKIFSELCAQAHDLGLGVVGEYFPVNDEKMSERQMAEEIKIGCRVLFELGADVIKTFHTKNFEKVVEGCPIPILTLGGKRGKSDLAALKMAETQIKSGASGLVFGRNIIQASDPIGLTRGILAVIKGKMPAGEAARKFKLK
jgi:DhnA family fructose-bisphosphate aldolase class Ia